MAHNGFSALRPRLWQTARLNRSSAIAAQRLNPDFWLLGGEGTAKKHFEDFAKLSK